ncbi:hypothetical protein ACH0BF_16660 [Pseudobacillus sp. 179-B 2D1 NHS]|uniref:hypothetical protein n=1 Tax=Pseudobacillus sp. 179-B 2D1 NHS TaxID=3374292 RepID=UPI003879275A
MPTIQLTFDDSIKKTSDYVDVRISNNKGVEMDQFKMTLDDVVMSISDSSFDMFQKAPPPSVYVSSSILPERCLAYSQYLKAEGIDEDEPYKFNQEYERFWIEIPKQRWDISVYNTFFLDTGFPRMLIGYNVSKATGQVSVHKLFALKDNGKRIKETDLLYKFPFSNVSEGHLCIGTTKLPTIKHTSELTEIHHKILFSSPFTNDWYQQESRNHSGLENVRELAMALTENDFPEEWLVSKALRVEDILK